MHFPISLALAGIHISIILFFSFIQAYVFKKNFYESSTLMNGLFGTV